MKAAKSEKVKRAPNSWDATFQVKLENALRMPGQVQLIEQCMTHERAEAIRRDYRAFVRSFTDYRTGFRTTWELILAFPPKVSIDETPMWWEVRLVCHKSRRSLVAVAEEVLQKMRDEARRGG